MRKMLPCRFMQCFGIFKILTVHQCSDRQLFGHSFPFTEGEYLSSGVNMLTNSLKISDTTKTKFFEVILIQSDQEI